MKTSKVKIDVPFFRIVANGGLSSIDVGEGRFLPSLVIDTHSNTEVSDLIKLHYNTIPGDTKLTWTKPKTFFKPKALRLNLEFSKPMKVAFSIEFNINDDHALIDGIIQSRGFYLQAGRPEDKISEFKNECILIEVPNLGIDEYWNNLLLETIKELLKKFGASKKESSILSKEHIQSMREIWNIRR